MAVEVEGAVVEHHRRRYPTQRRAPTECKDADGRKKEVDIGSFRDVAVDFVAGLVSGSAGIIVGQVDLTMMIAVRTTVLRNRSLLFAYHIRCPA